MGLVNLVSLVLLSFAIGGKICQDSDALRFTSVCETKLPFEERARVLVGMLKDEEKPPLLGNSAGGVPRLGLPSYEWWSEALHGIGFSPGVNFGTSFSTVFPQVIGLGATFNDTLIKEIGRVIGTEGRSLHNRGQANLTFWAPNINIFRDPRWGRGQETPGEDPLRNARYAENFVFNFQGGISDDNSYLLASSCCKHLDAYSIENWMNHSRLSFNAVVEPRDLQDTYLPAFKSCVEKGKASGLMASYNAVNGIPDACNPYLISTEARDDFQFSGYVTGDCGAVRFILDQHKFTANESETINFAFDAGLDLDCDNFVQTYLPKYLKETHMYSIDRALRNLFKVQMRIGLFDKTQYDNMDEVNTDAHKRLALEAAQQSIVLIKNQNAALPLNTVLNNLSVFGPNANSTDVCNGNYNGKAERIVSALSGIREIYPKAQYLKGCDMDSNSTAQFQQAADMASGSQVNVFVMGLDQTQEREGQDRVMLGFPGNQLDFLSFVSGKASNATNIVVILSGGGIDISEILKSEAIDAIIWAGYGGQSCGTAVSDVLFGNVSPSGRLPITWYTRSFEKVNMTNMNMRPSSDGYPGRTYRFFNGDVAVPFGFGLGYNNNFFYTLSSFLENVVNITVTNKGDIFASHAILAFTVPSGGGGKQGIPLLSLFDYAKVGLSPGQQQRVSFVVPNDRIYDYIQIGVQNSDNILYVFKGVV